ncbi:cellulose synthase/poly-beta-1,6-N-acetylglucosamine synthase-like glycosyltransferase [Pseudarthrobacter sp. W1I19]|uniref:glycosyltransferase n=1 Tax=Pseudarthrobacter sp. W1I19 TaxID=3042288 RepID=UPI00278AF8A7|nr:glycosyltransferase [Pseudarthrobacter sp. W1I19]MDQ0922356.1 cellulose synthase/poly-beta-1,6-N-acetylglucosamine synthase-like glycosyltransferase [Pseudarthrobacter sp. W1I19]
MKILFDGKVQRQTSAVLANKGQVIALCALLSLLTIGALTQPKQTVTVIIGVFLVFYALFVGLKLTMHIASLRYSEPLAKSADISDPDLPVFTVLVPLYKEANMLKSLVRSIMDIEYPKEKLQVLLLLEEDDADTRAEAIGMELPVWFRTVLIPDILPRGKPKALNMGLAQAVGAFCVIYDAEDRPDPDQLLKAVAAFRAAPEDVGCVQARLFFWNESSTWITRFYWIEYVIHFEWVLPGLAKLGLVPPLGGTSNHFKTEVLRSVAIDPERLPKGAEGVGGWDPWNVTEDAELAGALSLRGYSVKMIDSVTREEATASLRIADRQRRRWLKGYLQTGLTYTRHPFRTAREMGYLRWFFYILLVLGTPTALLLNPLFWGLTIAYFITRSPIIESFFPAPMFYSGLVLLVAGNLLLFYQMVIACLHRGGYGSVRYVLLTPLWWAFTSWSAYQVLWELARPATRHVWNKTPHGHDLGKEAGVESVGAAIARLRPGAFRP